MKLRAPFVWFGGKSKVAPIVWSRLGNVTNYIEPFFGSGAVLLARPHPPKIETINDPCCIVPNFYRSTDPVIGNPAAVAEAINDADPYVINFWRALQQEPESLANECNYPVSEPDLHARHRWLVMSEEACDFRQKMKANPLYYDVRFAAWWCWGLSCWIGGGWCTTDGVDWEGRFGFTFGKGGSQGINVKGQDNRKPRIDGGKGQYGHGIHAKGDELSFGKRPINGGGSNQYGSGIHAKGDLDDGADVCEQRLQWLLKWFCSLRDRLRMVRICCGNWDKVCSSTSMTTGLGSTGIFFDPPYSEEAGRDMNTYSVDDGKVAIEVRKYCLERGSDKNMRIALCGYQGEGHEELEKHGWECYSWEAHGGYGNRSDKGKSNKIRERIWFSPHCVRELTLFDLE